MTAAAHAAVGFYEAAWPTLPAAYPALGDALDAIARQLVLLARRWRSPAAAAATRASRQGQDATLVLDFTPNAIHAGIYTRDRAHVRPGRGHQPHVQSRRRRAPTRSSCSRPAAPTSRSSTSTISRSPASATTTSSGSWRSSSGRSPPVIAAARHPQPTASSRARRSASAGVPERHRRAATRSSPAPGATRTRSRRSRSASTRFAALLVSSRRRRDRVLERRGRRRSSVAVPGSTASASTPSARPPTPNWCSAPPGRRSTRSRASPTRSSARSSAATASRSPIREGSAADLEQSVHGLDPGARRRGAERRGARVPRPGRQFRGAHAERHCKAWSAWEARFGIVKRPPDVFQTFDPRFLVGTQSLIGN